MKKQLLVLALGVGTLTATAQNKAVNKADALVKKQEYAEALAQIEPATKDEKTKDKPKTYFILGQAYQGMAQQATDIAQTEQYMTKAVEAYNTAKSLEKDGGTYVFFVDQQINSWYNDLFNSAGQKFNDQDFESAIADYSRALMVNPSDSNSMHNIYVAAMQIEDEDKAAEMLNKLTDATSNKDYYFSLYNLESGRENYDAAQAVLEKGGKAYPEDITFSKLKVNLLLKQDKKEEAKAELDKSIAGDAENADLYFLKGYLNEETNNYDESKAAYAKALELDPTHKNAGLNLGALYYNIAAETLKEANNMGTSRAEEAKRVKLVKEATAQFKAAIPHLEKAIELNPETTDLLNFLMVTYYRAGEKAKGDALGDKIDKLGNN